MPLPDGSSTPAEVDTELNRLAVVFKPNAKPTEEAWAIMIREYVDALRRFPPKALHAGVTRLIASRKNKYWPLPCEIAEAVSDAADADRISRTVATASAAAQPRRVWTEAEAFATEPGRRALTAGLGIGFLAALNDGAAPGQVDFNRMAAARQWALDWMRGCDTANPLQAAAANLFLAMLAREKRLRDAWLGDPEPAPAPPDSALF